MGRLRPCRDIDRREILAIINAAAQKYSGVIPDDRYHEPYMAPDELDRELIAGVRFWGYDSDRVLVAVMGIQQVRDVDLVRHAYVLPTSQGQCIGGTLLEHLRRYSSRRMLVGTWSAAAWAIRFYERHGFELVSPACAALLLQTYWSICERQMETSVVLANPPLR